MHLSHHIVKAMVEERHRGLRQSAAGSRRVDRDANRNADRSSRANRSGRLAGLLRWATGLRSIGEVPAEAFSHRLDLTRDLPALRGYPVSGR